VNWSWENSKSKNGWDTQNDNDNTYRMVESAEVVMKTSEFLGCHEHDINSLTWPLQGKPTKVSEHA
jgi:hypothetical protein